MEAVKLLIITGFSAAVSAGALIDPSSSSTEANVTQVQALFERAKEIPRTLLRLNIGGVMQMAFSKPGGRKTSSYAIVPPGLFVINQGWPNLSGSHMQRDMIIDLAMVNISVQSEPGNVNYIKFSRSKKFAISQVDEEGTRDLDANEYTLLYIGSPQAPEFERLMQNFRKLQADIRKQAVAR
jgi:hypothetical protein